MPPPKNRGWHFCGKRSSPLPLRQRGFAKGIGKKREKEDQWSERKRLTASAAFHGSIIPEDYVRSITNLRTNYKQFMNLLCPYMVEKTAFLWYYWETPFFDKLLFVDFRTCSVSAVGEAFMPPVAQSVFAETPGIWGRFTAGRHECLPYSIFPTFSKQTCKQQFIVLFSKSCNAFLFFSTGEL